MKQLGIILSLVIGSAAHAYTIGDNASYLASNGGQSFDLKYEVTALNADNDFITIMESVISNGTVVQQQSEDSQISDTEQNEHVFDACMQMPAEFNPRYESLTVAAGSFNTCHLTMHDDKGALIEGYFAKVLFGIVKMTKTGSTDGSDMSMELKNFVRH